MPKGVSTFPQFFNHENQRAFRTGPNPLPTSVPGAGGYGNGAEIYPPFDSRNPESGAIKVLSLDLSVARNNVPFIFEGNSFWYKISTNASDTISVTFNDTTTNDPVPLIPKDVLQGFPFTKFFVTNLAIIGASCTIVIMLIPQGVVTTDEAT